MDPAAHLYRGYQPGLPKNVSPRRPDECCNDKHTVSRAGCTSLNWAGKDGAQQQHERSIEGNDGELHLEKTVG